LLYYLNRLGICKFGRTLNGLNHIIYIQTRVYTYSVNYSEFQRETQLIYVLQIIECDANGRQDGTLNPSPLKFLICFPKYHLHSVTYNLFKRT